MASLQARHQRTCAASKPWTTFEAANVGCTCAGGPTYYVVVREGAKVHRERVGKNRKTAERALTKIQAQEDDGAYVPQLNIKFNARGDRWRESLREPKENTRRGYASTIEYAKETFGEKDVRRIGTADIVRFLDELRTEKVGESTQAKHLRVLGACFSSAVAHGYAARNPVKDLPRSEKPAHRKREESAYFTNEELPKLFAEISEGAYRTVLLVALKTGMRQGELLALRWGNVKLQESRIHVRESWTDGSLGETKNRESRDVHLSREVVELLGAWWGECGRPNDGKLVFPGDTASGYMNPQTILRRELYPAMTRAGVPREGPTGAKRTFHSFRHTFAKVAIESGRPITWLSRHLGHSSLNVTTETYGHIEDRVRQQEAQQMEGVFAI